MIGRTLSHYNVLAEISRGGMGVVYRALDLKLDREVAIKVLPPELVADPERKRRFIQEAKAAAKLEHPHIGVVHEIDEVEGTTFIVMELIRGEPLRDKIAKGPLPLRRALEIATDVAEGLAKAHEEGIVHRDVKPANVMVTEDGHTKIIDFGLAKLVEPLAGEGSDIETLTRGETDPGKVMGTVSYMSPEQARGQKVDHRSDIFSFGIVLHEMVGGQPPFQGPTGADTLNAILSKPAPRLPSLGSDVSDEAAFELQHILEKCLAKDPAERYQTIKDIVIDLRDVRRRLESGPVEPAVRLARRKPWLYLTAGLAAAILLAGALYLLQLPSAEKRASVTATKPSIAVLYFENASGNPELDWLRTGLTDMLVTDLSQSPNLEVLSTDRLYQILEDMNRLDERITSLGIVQEVAQKAQTNTVVLGSFMMAGETIRINIRIQDAPTGKILATEKVEGTGESSIFPMVDDLTRRIKAGFEIPLETADGDLREVTTSSMEAFRYYTEGLNLHLRSKYKEAIALYEKAVAVDPQFAMALGRLSGMHSNVGHAKEAREYARRALELADRLPARERYYIEGRYYGQKEETTDRAIQVYEKAIDLFPDDHPFRNNLVICYFRLERCDEAMEHIKVLERRRRHFVGTYAYLARCGTQLGQFNEGYQGYQDFLSRNPKNSRAHVYLANHLTRWGKLDEATQSLQKAESLGPGHQVLEEGWFRVFTLRDQFEQAQAAAERLVTSNDPVVRLKGSFHLTTSLLYRGLLKQALDQLENTIRAYGETDRSSAAARNYAARLLIESGKFDEALEHAARAQQEARGNFGEWEGLFLAALAQVRLDRWDEVEQTAEDLRRKAESLPTVKEKRRHHHLLGELALARGDSRRAIGELEQAQSLLPVRGLSSSVRIAAHIPIWFSLASAYMDAEDEEKAAEWFQRITDSTTEHIWWPIPYVRSFYFLGKIHESRGEMEKAREYYRRFYEYWKDGDMDRERVEEAGRKISIKATS